VTVDRYSHLTPRVSLIAHYRLNAVSEETSLWALFASSFLAATLLPGGSEAVLFGVLKLHPGQFWIAIGVATIGNTLGGMSSYLIGRIIPQKKDLPGLPAVRKHGSPVLLLSWVPFIGDPLCVAAGWLRLDPWRSALFIALGKFARYLVVAGVAA
jgi:membrane protein YqaA with SNARE-associated domain